MAFGKSTKDVLRDRARGHRHRLRPQGRHHAAVRHHRRPRRLARAGSRSRSGSWVGKSADDAEQALEKRGLKVDVSQQYSDDRPRGRGHLAGARRTAPSSRATPSSCGLPGPRAGRGPRRGRRTASTTPPRRSRTRLRGRRRGGARLPRPRLRLLDGPRGRHRAAQGLDDHRSTSCERAPEPGRHPRQGRHGTGRGHARGRPRARARDDPDLRRQPARLGARARAGRREDAAFREGCAERGIRVFIHAPYLVNLGLADAARPTRARSPSVAHNLRRAAEIGAEGVVVHTGSYVDPTATTGCTTPR